MFEFFIVISFWAHDGNLHKVTSTNMPSREVCERMLKIDVQRHVDEYGNALGNCLTSPQRPAGLPEQKKKTKEINA